MAIADSLALIANTKQQLRSKLNIDSSVPFADYVNYINSTPNLWTPAALFSEGQGGAWYEPDDISTLFKDAAGTMPVALYNDPIALIRDKSGNGNDAVQTISARRPSYKTSPKRFYLDLVDDGFVINVPSGGWRGDMVLATDKGTATYGVSIPAGSYMLGGRYFTSANIIGVLFREGALTDAEKDLAEKYFVSKGAVESFVNIDNFTQMWRSFGIITNFPLINTSSANRFYFTWSYCSLLTTFPLLNTASVDNFEYAWIGCTSLTNFPANFFDNIKVGRLVNAFLQTNLSQESIDGILTSLVESGIATGTRVFGQSGGSAPSATGQAAIDTLRARGWTVNVTGGY